MIHFNRPVSVAAGSDKIFVSIRDGGAIYIFSNSGQFEKKSILGVSDRIRGLRFFKGRLYAVIQSAGKVLIMDPNLNITGQHDLKVFSPSLDSVDADSEGTVYITDIRHHCIYRVHPDGSRDVLGKGALKSPRGIRARPEGIYVCDRDNDCIRLIDKITGTVRTFLSHGRGKGMVRKPTDLEFIGDEIYVCDQDNYLIQIFNKEFKYIDQIGGKGTAVGTFDMANSMCQQGGSVLISNRGCDRIDRVDTDTRKTQIFILPEMQAGIFRRPSGICINDQNTLYIADRHNNCIQIFDNQSRYRRTLAGNLMISLRQPTAIEVNNRGELIIVDRENNRLVIYDGEQYTPVEFQLGLNQPRDVAVDRHDNIYVADFGNRRVVRKSAGSGAEEVICSDMGAKGLYVSPDNDLYVTDFDRNKIFLLNNGKMTNLIPDLQDEPIFNKIRGVCCHRQHLFIVDRDAECVMKLKKGGGMARKIGGRGPEHGRFRHPVNIKIKNENAYVVDRDNDRIEVFDTDLNYLTTIGNKSCEGSYDKKAE